MRLTNKLINEIVGEVAGVDVIPLIDALKDKKNISEFELASMTSMEVNAIRNMLYRLSNHNLVTFIRKKDKEKGWYIYYWTFSPKRVKYLVTDLKKKKLQKLKERLEREKENHFFLCENKCIRLDFEQAMDFNFKCPECNEIMHQEDNSKIIKKIKQSIDELEKNSKK